jgi:hypothetical protein
VIDVCFGVVDRASREGADHYPISVMMAGYPAQSKYTWIAQTGFNDRKTHSFSEHI